MSVKGYSLFLSSGSSDASQSFFFIVLKSPTRLKASSVDILLVWRGNISSFHLQPCLSMCLLESQCKRTFKKINHTPEYLVNHILYRHNISFEQHLKWCCFSVFSWHDIVVIFLHLLSHLCSPLQCFAGRKQPAG